MLPHTLAEDEAIGETSDRLVDSVRSEVLKTADKVGDAASEVYQKAVKAASDVYDVARERIVGETGLAGSAETSKNSAGSI
ncbi:hypothetical protein F4695_003896 [Rhizobium soli]|uniref:Uncharacterized protein n=1 Tax=Rhizobium soli TaxID=424798 RepID=A0A7X0JMU8_9HYPH|nr:hypothetical protein [Rhizobium soli]MBB6510505.1 hypothetical protein [Rhizobium soli]